MPLSPKQKLAYDGVTAVIAVAASTVLVGFAWNNREVAKIGAATWAVLVPAVFWFEYYYLWPKSSRESAAREIGMKMPIWVGVGAVLAALAVPDSRDG